jgi:selenocysteine lyase/cysteine desulfurase
VFDIARVRGLYESSSEGWTYLNAGQRAQLPEKVSSAVARAFRAAPLQGSSGHPRGDDYVTSAREAIADLVGSSPECVVLGPSRAALLSTLATAVPAKLRMGREVVLSRIDDPSNISPWQLAADLYGASVRWAEADLTSGALPAWQYTSLISMDTSIVAVPVANSHLGTVTDVRAIADTLRAKSRGWLIVDAGAYAPYRHIDMDAWDADVVALDIAPMGGPEVGAMVFRDPSLLAELHMTELRRGRHAAPDPQAMAARRVAALERDGVSPGLLGGVGPVVNHLAELDEEATGSRRERLATSLSSTSDYLVHLAGYLTDGLRDLDGVHVIGVDGEVEGAHDSSTWGRQGTHVDRLPRVSFLVQGIDAASVGERLLSNGVVAQTVGLEESALFDQMGVAEMGGAVCVALAPHNTQFDVDLLVRIVGGMV